MKTFEIFYDHDINLSEWLGFLGVLQILLAYFLNISEKLGTNNVMFKALNIFGALMAFVASYLLRFYPFMVLEAIWFTIALISLFRNPQEDNVPMDDYPHELIANMNPYLNKGTYVFVSVTDFSNMESGDALGAFRETEGTTLILKKEKAEHLGLPIDFVAAWITLKVQSSLEAVGLTAAFSHELATFGISCNVVAGYHHDHIFVNHKNAERALKILKKMASAQKRLTNDY
ncbi:ACT domain-containing protein [Flagellimonas sp. S174]|uniref:ACT domain-containing protein n=1 Tax=Flagellimonas sp. S174 TaxID=3410790 RepID=UPI003BF526AA